MRCLLTLVFACFSLLAFSRNATFEKLCEVNQHWRCQKDVSQNMSAPDGVMDERRWIAFHLALVEQTLRQKSTEALSDAQVLNRLHCLNYLRDYQRAGNFPVNNHYAYRTPIFIDGQNNFCAVGYLLKASGYEALARKISAQTNLAYVKEMHYPELGAWAREHGFTIDELAWIQPGYPPTLKASPVGAGVNGEVMELFADDTSGRLYVGGVFTQVDDSIPANNIAWLSEAGGTYSWHRMDSGLKGTVHTITKYKGRIFAAGNFTVPGSSVPENIAYWNDTVWTPADCLNGTIYDLAVMNGELYAAGNFKACGGGTSFTLAHWNDTTWQALAGLSGSVNTVYVSDTTLILGGTLQYNGVPLNVIKWSKRAGFLPFIGGIANEVKSFESFNNTLYASCKRTSTADSVNLLMLLKGNQWQPLPDSDYLMDFYRLRSKQVSINTLCKNGELLMMGGNFAYTPGIGTYGANCFSIDLQYRVTGYWFNVDSSINKMTVFKNELIAGGRFKMGYNRAIPQITLNGMARIPLNPPVSIPKRARAHTFDCFPNPASEATGITIKNNFAATRYSVMDIAGRQIAAGSLLREVQAVSLPSIAPGTYFLDISNEHGAKAVKPFVIR